MDTYEKKKNGKNILVHRGDSDNFFYGDLDNSAAIRVKSEIRNPKHETNSKLQFYEK